MSNIEILPLSQYDPEKDIILVYIDVGKMPPSRIRKHIEDHQTQLNPIFEQRGFKTLYIARRNDRVACEIQVDKKEVAEKVDTNVTEHSERVAKFIQRVEKVVAENNFDRAKQGL